VIFQPSSAAGRAAAGPERGVEGVGPEAIGEQADGRPPPGCMGQVDERGVVALLGEDGPASVPAIGDVETVAAEGGAGVAGHESECGPAG
jgi:hypothetical protein